MNNEIKQQTINTVDNDNYLINFDAQQLEIIRCQFFPLSATSLEIDYCLSVAKTLGLNPIVNEIYFVERKSNVNGMWISKVEPLAGRNAFRKIALKNKNYGGIKIDTYLKDTPRLVNGQWVDGKDLVARCEVTRKDLEAPIVVEVEYNEYVQKKRDGTPTKFWDDKPKTMLKKVAESQALKMAFDISGIYDEAEIETVEVTPTNTQLTQNNDDIDLNAMMENEVIQEPKKAEPETNTQTLKPKTDATLLSEIMVNDYEIPENIVKQWIEANDNYVTEVLNDVDKIGMLAENLTNS